MGTRKVILRHPPGRPYGLRNEARRILDEVEAAAMPEIGGKRLAGELGGMLADVRKMVDEAKLGLAGAVTELVTEIKSGKEVERAIRAEAAEVRKAFGEVLGNAPPTDPPRPNGGTA